MYGLTETSPLITICEPRPEHASLPLAERARIKARQGVELITSGELPLSDCQTGNGATVAELRDYARQHMAGFKVPKGFTFVDELPKTATGKIQKYVLRKGRSAISRQ